MRRPTFRFTIRRFMALTAVVAIVLASGITSVRLWRLRAEYRSRARQYAEEEQTVRAWFRFMAEGKAELNAALDLEMPSIDSELSAELKAQLSEDDRQRMKKFDDETRKDLAQMRELKQELARIDRAAAREMEYHADLARKYRRAANRPWESVPPDPREPGYGVSRLLFLWDRAIVNSIPAEIRDHHPPPGVATSGNSTEAHPARRAETR